MADQGYNSRCHVCTSEQRILVETLLARGLSAVAIAAKVNLSFGNDASKKLTAASVHRHRKHMPGELIQRLKAKSLGAILGKGVSLAELRARESENLLAHICAYRAELDQDIATARFNGDLAVVSSLAGRRNHLLETLARLLGELGISTVVNNVQLVSSPEYLALMATLYRALAPFPDARRAVAAALEELGAKSEPIEVEVKEIGTSEAASPARLASATETLATAPVVAREIPTVLRLEQYSESRTPERIG